MKILRTRKELLNWRKKQRGILGFVPTMGALHEGHLSLVLKAQKDCDQVVVSIFVNPTQFGPKEDLAKYPRSEKRDLKFLRQQKVDAVFIPRAATEVYARSDETRLKARSSLSNILCGKFRPGHFDGVVSVVYKLFSWVQPHRAFFGEKDYQQLKIIEALVEDLGLPVKIVPCPTHRESSGLAMSSRNQYLSSAKRTSASELVRALRESKTIIQAKSRLRTLGFKIQYLESWAPDLTRQVKAGGRWLVAAYYDGVRLIDNVDRRR